MFLGHNIFLGHGNFKRNITLYTTPTVLTLKSNLCYVFGFLDTFQSGNGIAIITKATQQCAENWSFSATNAFYQTQ